MKQIIKDVLDDMSNSQVNLGSSAARKMISTLISSALKSKGCYTEYDDDEIDEQKARDFWVCSICGKSTYGVDYDYIGSGTNHLGCELEIEMGNKEDDVAKALGHMDEDGKYITRHEKNSSQKKHDEEPHSYIGGSEEIDGAYTAEEFEEWEEAVSQSLSQESNKTYRDDFPQVEELEDGSTLPEDDTDYYTGPDGHYNKSKDWDVVRVQPDKEKFYSVVENLGWDSRDKQQKKIGEITKQEYGNLLSEQIVDNKDKGYLYESPDGGKTVFRRLFGDDDPKNKEEINWKTKELTGKTFLDYPWHKEKKDEG